MSPSKIDILLRLVPDNPSSVLQSLTAEPDLASQQDQFGYSLLHAASSYGHVDLLRKLVRTFGVDVNILDADGDTPLHYAESEDVVRCLVEELGSDVGARNVEGVTAEEKIREEGEGSWVVGVLEYLQFKRGVLQNDGDVEDAPGSSVLSRPGMVPENVEVKFGTMQELPEQEADPEFRRRIEELASKGDLDSEEAQRELKKLVEDVVSGIRDDEGRDTQRRRIDE